ncbi:Hypothetical protein R9X50_00665700 [Acrodontium crateriforme]|uniref:Chromo domain-containing protein n=1 Tax=Acrodontium crateriforme TaxID=150365 RepID=A0AAQ3M9A1_9PEZI|nr:Hypothetical protein R9X50_00665700 [Acrodontium crateriforme]
MTKRKRSTTASSALSKKRAKVAQLPYSLPPDESEEDDYYSIKEIVDERGNKYLISWEDNKETGEKYPDSWEPKQNVTKAAIDEWNEKKSAREIKKKAKTKSAPPPARKGQAYKIPAPVPQPRTEFVSSGATTSKTSAAVNKASTKLLAKEAQPFLEIFESQQSLNNLSEGDEESRLFVRQEPAVAAPFKETVGVVQIERPPSSFAEGAYEKISQLPETQPTDCIDRHEEPRGRGIHVPNIVDQPEEFVVQPEPTELFVAPQQLFSSQYTSKVIPDSQSLLDTTTPIQSVEKSVLPGTPNQQEEFATDFGHPDQLLHHSIESPQLSIASVDYSVQYPSESIKSADTVETQRESIVHSPVDHCGPRQNSESEIQSAVSHRDIPQSKSSAEFLSTQEQGRIQEVQTQLPSKDREIPPQQSVPASSSSFPFETQLEAGFVERGNSLSPPKKSYKQLNHTIRASSFPVSAGTSLPASSSLASIPSQSLRAVGESAPHRSTTPSSPFVLRSESGRMGDTPSSIQSMHAQLKALRDGLKNIQGPNQPLHTEKAGISASPLPKSLQRITQESRRSPSVVPAQDPPRQITLEEMNQTTRYETLVPQAQEPDSSSRQRNGSLMGTSTLESQQSQRADDVCEERCATFQTISIPLFGHQRDQYFQRIVYKKSLIQSFLNEDSQTPEAMSEVENFVQQMYDVALHPDLVNAETFTQLTIDPMQQAAWDVQCSAKFRFLKHIFDYLKGHAVHVALVVPAGNLVCLLETFLLGTVKPVMSASNSKAPDTNTLDVTVIAMDNAKAYDGGPADLVIGLDHNCTRSFAIPEALLRRNGKRTRLVSLVVPNSIEHIDLSVSTNLSKIARLRAVINAMQDLKKHTGKADASDDSDSNSTTLCTTAQQIANFLTHEESEVGWAVPTLSPLQELDSQTESETSNGTQGEEQGPTPGARSKKRSLNQDDQVPDSHKKTRFQDVAAAAETTSELPHTVNLQEIEISHISDSTPKEAVMQNGFYDDSMVERHGELVQYAHRRIRELEEALADVQFRFEEQRETVVKASAERDSALLTAQKAVKKSADQFESLVKARTERNELRQQLDEANASLLSHAIPERAEFEALRQELVQARAEKDKAEARLKSVRGDLDYAQQMYQTSSNGAKEVSDRNRELESEVIAARSRLGADVAKLRQMGYDAQTKNMREENRRLKLQLRDREAGLKLRDEEIARLKEASRGRMGTRVNSLPRTPRLGSPMKFEPSARGRGSRQQSPANGDAKHRGHPLRRG